jgi:hypothetical protein
MKPESIQCPTCNVSAGHPCEIANNGIGTGRIRRLPHQSRINLAKARHRPVENPLPWTVKPVKEYSGDVQQMSSPFKETGYYYDRWAILDSSGGKVATFNFRKTAEFIVQIANQENS